MFDKSDVLESVVTRVFEFAKDLERGDILHLEDIERIVGCERYEGQWGGIVRKVRLRIRDERGIATRSVVTVGYKLLTKEEQVTVCPQDRQRRASRQITRGIQEVAALDASELNVHQAQRRSMALDAMRRERRAIKRAVREQATLARPWQGLPKREVASK